MTMTDRFDKFIAALAGRDASLTALALLALGGLACWWLVRAVLSERAQNRVLTLGVICFYATLAVVIFYGG